MFWVRRAARLRFDLWEITLGVLLVGVLVFVGVRSGESYEHSAHEREYFRRTYGPHHFTDGAEEWLIRDFFHDRRGGTFVDVGANHYRQGSKTYYLERNLGWSGLAVEPQREFEEGYRAERPRTKFLPLFVSNVSQRTAQLFVNRENRSVASSNREFVAMFGTVDEVREMPTVTLSDLLDGEGIRTFDFLSIDIELHEPEALGGFDIERFRPALVCIEALLPVRQRILDYFAHHGYVVVGSYVWVDRENLYFMPLDERFRRPPAR